MPAINFPNNPIIGQVFIVNDTRYVWDGTSWYSSTDPRWIQTTSTISKTLVPYESCYFLATATATLPLTPAQGTRVQISVGNFSTLIIARNGQILSGLAEDMTVDIANTTLTLRFVDTVGWIIA